VGSIIRVFFTLEAIIYIIMFTLGPMTQATLVVMIYQSTLMSSHHEVCGTTKWQPTNKPSLQRKSSALLKEPRREGGTGGATFGWQQKKELSHICNASEVSFDVEMSD
jgi:hypothetical protein